MPEYLVRCLIESARNKNSWRHTMTPEQWARIEDLYHRTLAVEKNERKAFLRDICADDPELRQELERLLSEDNVRESFLEEPVLQRAVRDLAEPTAQSWIGRRVGSYEVLSLLGIGGMGEVYRARDTKLRRDVAIKVLPKAFAENTDRLRRFEREAQALASFNHPHIGAIYGFEEVQGERALILELIEGESLSDRLSAGALPVEQALKIAQEIALALEAAHEKGILHRDLKPANIKITPDGTVKVLDFGLAKSFAEGGPEADHTLTTGRTEEGAILGTVAYMSPEQARGRPVDKRTDIWAFGCVLFEMFTGTTAFSGDTTSDTLAAVLEREPDWTLLPASAPGGVARLIHRMLVKDPKRRIRDIGDARIEIDEALSRQSAAADPIPAPVWRSRPAPWRLVTFASIVAVASGAAMTAIVLTNRENPESRPYGAAARTIATQLTNYGGTEAGGALSPDGRSFVFASDQGGSPDIWLRQVSGGEPVRLTNDAAEEADPVYAPDGESIYFTRRERNGSGIWQTGILGGQPRKVLDDAQKPAPSRDGRSLAYVSSEIGSNGLIGYTIKVSGLNGGSTRELVRSIPPGWGSPRPAWSPDGRWIAYSAGALFGPAGVFVVDAPTGQQRQVTQLPFGTNDSGQPAWLPDNRHLLVSYLPFSRQQAPADIGVIDSQDGSISRLTTTVADGFSSPSVSADGSRLIVTSSHFLREVWKVPLGSDPDANGREAVRLLEGSAGPLWTFVSRDGRTLLFNSPSSGSRNLWTMPVDGSAPARQITAVPGDAVSHSSLSPDGKRVAFASTAAGRSDIWTQNVDGTDLRQLTNDEPADSWPVWSPDGQWIAYLSFRDGRPETWRVRSAGGSLEKFPDGPSRGDWILQPGGGGTLSTWTIGGGLQLRDVERGTVLWTQPFPGLGLSLPMFSPDARSISAPFRETRDHDAVRIFDVATGKSRIAVRLPFHVAFRASWVDDGRALVVNRVDQISHIVLFDRFWDNEPAKKP
jgi:eukaryotic-like serine/threonine-protein kinase